MIPRSLGYKTDVGRPWWRRL